MALFPLDVPPPPTEQYGPVIAIGVLAAVVVIGVVLFLVIRNRRKPQ